MDCEKLISIVFKRPILWNQAHLDHQNGYIITKLWDEVAFEMDANKDAVQKKWKYLRDYFRQENAKQDKVRSGDSGNKCWSSSWQFYKSLLCLKDHMANRASDGNLKASCCNDQSEEGNQASEEMFHSSSTSSAPSEETSQHGNILNPSNVEANTDTTRSEPRVVVPGRKRKRPTEQIGEALLEVEREKIAYFKEKHEKKCQNSEDTDFFQSLLPQVTKIAPENKLLIRKKMLDLAQDFAYGNSVPTPVSSRTGDEFVD